jgi:O-antigen/teichoic acid export membrane protein
MGGSASWTRPGAMRRMVGQAKFRLAIARRRNGAPTGTPEPGFAAGARVLSIGIASTGLFTFAYLASASRLLGRGDYSRIALCWAIMYVILSVIYRPVEQLLSRTIADRRARGISGRVLRAPAIIQGSFAACFLTVALALRVTIERRLFGGSEALYWVLVVGVLAYAASYFARGWLAGHRRFALYGGLVFLESTSRFLLALAVALGAGSGLGAVASGMAAAPFVSLCVIPLAFSRLRGGGSPLAEVLDAAGEGPVHGQLEEAVTNLSLRQGSHFAVSVVAIMLSEQTLMNAGVLVVAADRGFDLVSGLTGFVFNVLLIVRAPLQLFQAIQTSILPHLTRLEAHAGAAEFGRAVRVTVLAIVGFAAAVTLGLLAIGPQVMQALLGSHGYVYDRLGLALVGVGMGFHLASGTLNQALLARGRPRAAAACWLLAAAAFVCFVALPTIPGEVGRVETGYCAAATLLTGLLYSAYRRK